MNCRRTLRALPLFVGGDLDAARAAEVERHIADCESCAAEVEIFAASRQSLFALKGEPAAMRSAPGRGAGGAPDLWPSIRLRLGTPPRVRRWVPVRAAAAVLLVAAGAIALFIGSGDGGGLEERAIEGREPPVVAHQVPYEEPVEVPFESRISAGPGAFVLAEVGPSQADNAAGSLPAVMPAEPERTGWDEF